MCLMLNIYYKELMNVKKKHNKFIYFYFYRKHFELHDAKTVARKMDIKDFSVF